jgi:hypothetical protein
MLKRLKRWLGWDTGSGLFDFADFKVRQRTASSPPKPATPVSRPVRVAEPPPAAERRPKADRTPLDVLDNPRLTLDKPADDGFDPYNTGAFNRSASWERIGRQRKR